MIATLAYHPLLVGEWPSGKAPDSGSGERRFESFLASHPYQPLGSEDWATTTSGGDVREERGAGRQKGPRNAPTLT